MKIEQAIRLLEEFGPMTSAELSLEAGCTRQMAGAVMWAISGGRKTMPKRAHVSHYVYDMEGQRRYPRAVYALGDKPDAKPPPCQRKVNAKRFRDKARARRKENNIFNLALQWRAKDAMSKMHRSEAEGV